MLDDILSGPLANWSTNSWSNPTTGPSRSTAGATRKCIVRRFLRGFPNHRIPQRTRGLRKRSGESLSVGSAGNPSITILQQ